MSNFDITIDEGMISEKDEKGNYGPYTQSQRKDIYQTYIKYLIEQGQAYPCFCTHEEIEETRQIQEKENKELVIMEDMLNVVV